MSEPSRRPTVFKLGDPAIVLPPPIDDARLDDVRQDDSRAGDTALVPAIDAQMLAPAMRRRRMPWGGLFWSACTGLVLLFVGHATYGLVDDLFARAQWLGALGAGLAALASVALIAIIAREAIGLARLGKIEGLRERALDVLASDDRIDGRLLAREVLTLTAKMPRLARGRTRLTGHLDDIIDGADLVRLTERELMPALDAEAKRLVFQAAKRVSVVTAVSPRAVVDMLFVAATAIGLARKLAILYGGRPGALGLITLMRHAVSHLAVTGSLAATDSVLQQMIGHGVAAKLSAKLGEGLLNGLLTARLGVAAIEVARPLPFTALPRPTLNELAGSLFKLTASGDASGKPKLGG